MHQKAFNTCHVFDLLTQNTKYLGVIYIILETNASSEGYRYQAELKGSVYEYRHFFLYKNTVVYLTELRQRY